MQIIQLENIPNQSFNTVLNRQNCIIHLYQRGDYMYLDLTVNKVPICQGRICLVNRNILAYRNINFTGYLFFTDITGQYGVPNYKDLNTRYILSYATEEE